jgi:PAS domain S-box-containing protein
MRIMYFPLTKAIQNRSILLFFSMVLSTMDADCINVTNTIFQQGPKVYSLGYSVFSGASQSFFYNLNLINIMSGSSLFSILSIVGLLIIICSGILVFSMKLKRLNEVLKYKNSELDEVNGNLKKLSKELICQKEEIVNEMADSEKFYAKLIDSADDAISFYDAKGNLKFANPAFYSIIGIDKKEFDQMSEPYFVHPDDLSFFESRINGLNRNGFYSGEFRLKHTKGHYVPLSTKSVLIKNDQGVIMGSMNLSRDITSLKMLQNDLLKAKEDAEGSYKLKSNFLANISHEVRTPLNSVVGFSNLLLSDDITREAKAEYIEHINHNSEKLLQIIGDIIDLSRLESSQIEISYEEASINDIVTEVIEEARKQIKRNEKAIILTVRKDFKDLSDLIFTDQIWLKRILNHLMDNAIKFTLEGFVELSYSKEGDNLFFKIKDTGIGINKDNLGHIFEEFRQEINGHQRPFEGLGIGLTLAKEVVERMGGKISVISEKGIGSEFSFIIPFRPAGTNKLKTNSSVNMNQLIDWTSRKCLLVDDNKEVLIYLTRILLDTGIEIITARSGREAIEILKNNPLIDVVLLDMQMPEMNGIEATKEIRAIRKDIPIIAQTAFVFEHDKDIILEAGCDACLIKPIRKDHLLAVMANFIKTD